VFHQSGTERTINRFFEETHHIALGEKLSVGEPTVGGVEEKASSLSVQFVSVSELFDARKWTAGRSLLGDMQMMKKVE